MKTLISADQTVVLLAFLFIAASASIIIEQRYKWSAKVPGAVIALIIAISFSSFNIIPTDAAVYDMVWAYVVPIAIPLLLFQVNVKSIFTESRRLLFIFLLSSIGTIVGAFIAFFIFKDWIPELDKISGMMSASYIGGGVNFAAMTAKLAPTKDMVASTIVADNLIMALYFIVLLTISAMSWFRKRFKTPYIDEIEKNAGNKDENLAASYWQPRNISLKDIAINMGASLLIVAVSFTLADGLKPLRSMVDHLALEILVSFITDPYLILTTLTFLVIYIFQKPFQKLNGSQELGTYMVYLFFVVIGIPASIPMILQNAPLLLLFVITIMLINLIVSLLFGKLFKFTLEEILLACNANVGGPTTAAAMAISKGWRTLVGPILVIGTVGYVVGNYAGTIIYLVTTRWM